MVGLAYNYIGSDQAGALLEVLRMANALEDLVAQTLTLGREQGIEQGREQGIEQGRLEARRDDLAHLILRRFHLAEVPAPLAARLDQADEATLIELRDRVLDVALVEEL
jgi:hypothetical protein